MFLPGVAAAYENVTRDDLPSPRRRRRRRCANVPTGNYRRLLGRSYQGGAGRCSRTDEEPLRGRRGLYIRETPPTPSFGRRRINRATYLLRSSLLPFPFSRSRGLHGASGGEPTGSEAPPSGMESS